MDFDDLQIYSLVLKVCGRLNVNPSASIEAEDYFRELLLSYDNDISESEFDRSLTKKVAEDFISLGKRPNWIQGANWPFANGKPMIFAGQLDISISKNEKASRFFHDDTSIYIFLGRDAEPKVIVQQF